MSRRKLEEKWQEKWSENNVFDTPDSIDNPRYVLAMFPYPSGRLHMGHVRNYTLADAYARFCRLNNYDVLHPIGWDSFGLPAENAAKDRDKNPRDWIDECVSRMRKQLKALGISYDWSNEFKTSDKEAYRWSQWLFLELYENGYVTRKTAKLNWCSSCETVLADAQVEGEDELCWRCENPVQQKEQKQWFIKTTEFSEQLGADIETLDWPEEVKSQQENWIGEDGENLEDWLISRQRYWGTPIPVIRCDNCGHVPEDKDNLPVELPEKFVPTEGNPLDLVDEFKETVCPDCGRDAVREIDTMDTFVDSSWYFLKFASGEQENPFTSDVADSWMPVEEYIGGIEHATTHLVYARFIMHALKEIGHSNISEPFNALTTQGMVLLDGEKMSKSKGNTVEPSNIINQYGADTARWFICEAAAPENDFNWGDSEVESVHEFLLNLQEISDTDGVNEYQNSEQYLIDILNETLEVVNKDYNNLRFHRVTTEVREFINELNRYMSYRKPSKDTMDEIRQKLSVATSPIVPHIAEEMDSSQIVSNGEWVRADKYTMGVKKHLNNLRSDIEEISKIVNFEPDKIQISIAAQWKYDAAQIAVQEKENAVDVAMSKEQIREHGNDAVDIINNFSNADSVFTSTKEKKILDKISWIIGQEYNCDVSVNQSSGEDSVSEPEKPEVQFKRT